VKKLKILGCIIGISSTLSVLWLFLIGPTVDHFRYLDAEKKIESFDAKGQQIGSVGQNIRFGLVVAFHSESDPRPYLKYLPCLTGVVPPPLPFQKQSISPRYEHLLLIPGIQHLSFQDSPYISDNSLDILRQLPYLKDLLLQNTKITNEGLEHVASCGLLETLFLSETKIDSNGLKPLFKLQRLKELDLCRTKVGDKLVDALCERYDIFPYLETINLENTLVSSEAKEKLRKTRRGVTVK
jgi:hypothetical protein